MLFRGTTTGNSRLELLQECSDSVQSAIDLVNFSLTVCDTER